VAPRSVELCVSALVVDHDERVLMVKRSTDPARGLWAMPGGRVEPGETMREAVVRETAEETGVGVLTEKFVGWSERIDEHSHFVIATFAAVALEPGNPRPGSDAAEAEWVPLWQVSDLELADGVLDFLSEHGYVSVIS
jgi:ADP-ribose pyrophosphatase YjhB (NUDIX family)